jgi:hypothetical protein
MLINMDQVHWYNGTWWTAVTGAGQVIATFVAAWAALEAKRSAEAARDAVQVARDSVQSTEEAARYRDRAYLAVEDSTGPKVVGIGTPITMTFIYKNVGLTPAYQVEFGTTIFIDSVRHSEQQMDDSLRVWHQLGTAPPSLGLTAASVLPTGPLALDEERYVQLMRGELFMVLLAKLRYKDIFGHPHETRVAYEFQPDVRRLLLATYFNTMT